MRNVLLCLFLLFPVFSFSEARFSLNIGHNQVINSVDFDVKSNFIYTASDDGKLLIHDVKNDRIYKNLQLSSLQLKSIVKHPNQNIAAVYETDNINTYQISVWNLDSATKLYSHVLSEAPLYMDYSPKGTYLVYTSARWNSITFLDAESGDIIPLIDNGFGIVPSLFISSSEKTLVAYGPSGKIFYIDLNTGEPKSAQPITTLNDLLDVHFHYKGRFMTGVKSTTLYLIDIVSGSIVDSLSAGKIKDTAVLNDSIALYVQEGSYYSIKKILIKNNVLMENSSNDRDIPLSQGIALTPDYILLPGISGELHVFDSDSLLPIEHSVEQLEDITSLQERNNHLYLLKSTNIYRFANDYSAIEKVFDDFPINGFYVTDDVFLFWDTSMTVYSYNEEADIWIEIININDGIKSVISFEKTIAVLSTDGTLYVIPLSNTGNYRKFPTKGLNSIVMTDENTILGGRNVGGTFDTALIQINAETGESIGIENPNKMIVEISFDPVTQIVYTLGVQNRRGRQYTVISEMNTKDFTRSEPIAAFKGIDNTIRFAADPLSTKFFTSTGINGLEMYSWGGFTSLSHNLHITGNLIVTDKHLISRNTDHSISFWDKSNGDFICDIYIFNDENILITYKNGNYYTSNNRTDIIQYFDNGQLVKNTRTFFDFMPF